MLERNGGIIYSEKLWELKRRVETKSSVFNIQIRQDLFVFIVVLKAMPKPKPKYERNNRREKNVMEGTGVEVEVWNWWEGYVT